MAVSSDRALFQSLNGQTARNRLISGKHRYNWQEYSSPPETISRAVIDQAHMSPSGVTGVLSSTSGAYTSAGES